MGGEIDCKHSWKKLGVIGNVLKGNFDDEGTALKFYKGGWTDGSAVKSVHCSAKDLILFPAPSSSRSQLLYLKVQGNLTLSKPLWYLYSLESTHMETQIYIQTLKN